MNKKGWKLKAQVLEEELQSVRNDYAIAWEDRRKLKDYIQALYGPVSRLLPDGEQMDIRCCVWVFKAVGYLKELEERRNPTTPAPNYRHPVIEFDTTVDEIQAVGG